jgi:hypothetical protein
MPSVTFAGLETNTAAITAWSSTNVSKSKSVTAYRKYGVSGYAQIKPGSSQISQSVNANNIGISAPNPTLVKLPDFLSSIGSGAGTLVNFPGYPTFLGPDGVTQYRQGSLSVGVNQGPFTSPSGNSYYGYLAKLTLNRAVSFRVGVVTDAVAAGQYSPDHVQVYNATSGGVFSSALSKDAAPNMAFFDITGVAGDQFDINLWQVSGSQSVAAAALITFDEIAVAQIAIRDNLYATGTEEGTKRFRRLVSLGYV